MTKSEAIEHLKNIAIYSVQDGYTDEARQALDMAIKALEEPERKKGKWISHESVFGGSKEMVYTCDQCGHNIGFHMENYCPSCGADMRGKEKE